MDELVTRDRRHNGPGPSCEWLMLRDTQTHDHAAYKDENTCTVDLHPIVTILLQIRTDPLWCVPEQAWPPVELLKPGQFWMQICVVSGPIFGANQQS